MCGLTHKFISKKDMYLVEIALHMEVTRPYPMYVLPKRIKM